MKKTTLNSDGSPVLIWDETVEGESELQRIRRRYQQRRCVACGAPERMSRRVLCAACWEAGQRYCAGCERIVPESEYCANWQCRTCHTTAQRVRRQRQRGGKTGAQAIAESLQRRSEAGRAIADEMHVLRARGWTWKEIARRFNLPNRKAAMARYAYYYAAKETGQ